MADRSIAQRVFDDARLRRRRVMPVRSQSGLTAMPVFPEFQLSTVEHLLDATPLSPTEVAVRLTTPLEWICNQSKAPTAELAIAQANEARMQKQRARAATTGQAEGLGLPSLVGSVKQRTWANQIRARHAATSPNSAHLKTKLLAAWWIENQRTLE